MSKIWFEFNVGTPNEFYYYGGVKNGKLHGKGTLLFPGRYEYIGDFKDNQEDGWGFCKYASGEIFDGMWSKGQKNGVGTLFRKNYKINGYWKNNVLKKNLTFGYK